MKIKDLLQNKKVTFSCEIFPPKAGADMSRMDEIIRDIAALHPDFISVTYGAGGSENCKATLKIASRIKNEYGIESVAHLPCISLTKSDVRRQLSDFKEAGIENILALRGDVPSCGYVPGDFRHASDLIAFIKEHGDFNVLGACYPEGHQESADIFDDIKNLKTKVDAGASHLITQLFFDNHYFYRFRERASLAGIQVPIEAGIMPVTNAAQMTRILSLSGTTLPNRFRMILDKFRERPDAMKQAGIVYAAEQMVDLVANGVRGVHVYTMNKPDVAAGIAENLSKVLGRT